MCTRDSPDIYTLGPWASGVYIRQTMSAHGITIKYTTLHGRIKENCRAIYLLLPSAEGKIKYIALSGGQYSDIAREGGFQQSFEQLFDIKLS